MTFGGFFIYITTVFNPMLPEDIISNIEAALIRHTAGLDAWFDHEDTLHRTPREGWSTRQVLEHVMRTNHYLLKLVRKGSAQAIRAARAGGYTGLPSGYCFHHPALELVGTAGAFRWETPEHMVPSGTLPVGRVRKTLRDQLYECLKILDTMPAGEGAYHKITMSVNSIGMLDMYQYLYFLALHQKRHLEQISKLAGVHEELEQL